MTAMTIRGAIDLELPDYETASLVGQHNAAVKAFMGTNDVSHLRPFEGRTVKDTFQGEHMSSKHAQTWFPP